MPKLKQAETEIVYVKATTQEVSFEWFLHCGVKNVQSVHDWHHLDDCTTDDNRQDDCAVQIRVLFQSYDV